MLDSKKPAPLDAFEQAPGELLSPLSSYISATMNWAAQSSDDPEHIHLAIAQAQHLGHLLGFNGTQIADALFMSPANFARLKDGGSVAPSSSSHGERRGLQRSTLMGAKTGLLRLAEEIDARLAAYAQLSDPAPLAMGRRERTKTRQPASRSKAAMRSGKPATV